MSIGGRGSHSVSPENTKMHAKCWLKASAMSTELETTFRTDVTPVAVFLLLDGTDIFSGTLLALLPSLKTDQNRFGRQVG